MNYKVDIHADDYALSIKTSEEIFSLMQQGILDSISIIPNNSCYNECIHYLTDHIKDLTYLPKMSVHINLVEGLSLSQNDGSLINSTWKSLFLASYNPFKRRAVKEQLKREIYCQIKKTQDSIDECIRIAKDLGISVSQKRIRIDSHQHSHMIPIVWESITEVLEENGLETEYIRNSKEPLIPFLKHVPLWKSYSIINIVKNRILWMFSHAPDRYAGDNKQEKMYLWGLVMSGNMDRERISVLYESMAEYALAHNRRLEILFHPGRMSEDEMTPEIPRKSADSFYLSHSRDVEKEGASSLYNIETPGIV